MVKASEVEVALNVQRFVVVGIDGEVLEQQFGVDYAHGVVVEAQANTIGLAHHIGGVEIDFAIDNGFRQWSLHCNRTFAIALEADDLVRNEAIDER